MKIIVLIVICLVPLLIIPAFGEMATGKPAWVTNSEKVCGDKLCSEIDDSYAEDSAKVDDLSAYPIGFGRELLKNEKGEWILYDKRYGYSVMLPNWEFKAEADYRSRDLVVVYSLDKTDARFSPVFHIRTPTQAGLSFDYMIPFEENLDDLIRQDFLNEKNTELISDVKIKSIDTQILDDQIIVDISSEIYYPYLTPTNNERRTIYSDSGQIYRVIFSTGFSDYDDYISDYKESIETLDISYADFREFSPHKQIEFGLPPKAVLCDFSYVLVLKQSDNLPACVKSSTFQKLAERGWTHWDLMVQ